MELKNELKEFIISIIDVEIKDGVIGDDENLIEIGVVDSMVILNLLAYFEENYGILFAEDELNEENFATIEKMNSIVKSKMESVEC